jgi:hypothetical protein
MCSKFWDKASAVQPVQEVTIPRPAERKRQAALDAEAAVQKVMDDLHSTLSLMRN